MSSYNKDDTCRMYINEKPNKDDIVIVEVISIEESFVNCKLLEYDNLEAMLSLRNIQRRRFRGKIPLRKRQTIYCKVLTEEDNKFTDISKRDVSPDEIEIMKIQWIKCKFVHSLFKTVLVNSEMTLSNLYENFGWKLCEEEGGHIYDNLDQFVENPELMDNYDLEQDIKDLLITTIIKRFKAKEKNVRATIEMSCFTHHGIEGIKAVFRKNRCEGIKMCVINCPLYSISMRCLNTDEGVKKMDKIINQMGEDIKEYGGTMNVKDNPKVFEKEGDNHLNK
jgi:translation initiation factor 2 alpha subunit (eIF-2alpha)